MLGGFLTSILYLLGIVNPHLRYSFHPVHVLAAWTETEGEVSVRWSTGLPAHYAELMYREVQCEGRRTHPQWRTVSPDIELFFKYKVIFWEYIYTAIVRGLEEKCRYEYQIGSGMYQSEVFTISGRTPDYTYSSLKTREPASLVVLGDMGKGNFSQATRSFLRRHLRENKEFAAILHLGDVAYDLDYAGGMVGDEYLSDLDGISERIPYMLTPGNHENAHNFTHYRRRFRMPKTEYNGQSGMFYSFNLGPAHFVMYSTEVYDYNSPEAQLTQRNWLIEDLDEAVKQRSSVPWIFVLGHKPQYCNIDWTRSMESVYRFRSNDNCGRESSQLRVEFEDIFYSHSVDIVFAGHVHRYEREAAIYRNLTVPSEVDQQHLHLNARAPIHIISGIAGSDHEKNPISRTPQLWNRFESNDYGFGVLTVLNKTHVYWEQWNAEQGEVVDYLWVVKTRSNY